MMSTDNLKQSVDEAVFTDAGEGEPANHPVTFDNKTLKSFSVQRLMADEDAPPEEDHHSAPQDYAFAVKTSNLKRDRAKFLLEGYEAVGVNKVTDKEYLNLTTYMEENVRVITPKVLDNILEKETKSGRIDEFGIVDLRDTNDKYQTKIRGAFDMPCFNAIKALIPTGSYESERGYWNKLISIEGSPLPQILKKRVLIFHCMQSRKRTPQFVSGYAEILGQPEGQEILILEGGFEGYKGANLVERSVAESIAAQKLMPKNMAVIGLMIAAKGVM